MKLTRESLCSLFVSPMLTLSLSLNSQQPELSPSKASIVPHWVNFSGRADPQGKPVRGITGVTVAIFKDEEGGAPRWTETQNVQTDAKGNYSVQLGANTREGLALNLFTSSGARWRGVQVNGAPRPASERALRFESCRCGNNRWTSAPAFVPSKVAQGTGADSTATGSSLPRPKLELSEPMLMSPARVW